jgi:ribosomal protein S12 methylthiotransferase accessory factor
MSSRSRSLDRRFLELVSDRVGLIKSISMVKRGADEPCPPYICQATISNFDFKKAPKIERMSAGKGRTPDEAMMGAIGEAVERYCAAHVDPQKLVRSRAPDLPLQRLTPPEFVLYSDRQYSRSNFRYHRWDPADEVTWIQAVEPLDGADVFVPSTLVYLSGPPDRPQDFFCPSTSNGLAAGVDIESAVLSGLCELIERDAFLLRWMCKAPAREVQFPETLELAGRIRRHFERFGTEIRVLNLSLDLPGFVMMAVALGRSDELPSTLVGLGCHPDPRIAVVKAMLEICQIHPGEVQRHRTGDLPMRLKAYTDVQSLDDHSAFMSLPAQRPEFDFLLHNPVPQPLNSLPVVGSNSAQTLARMLKELASLGYRVCFVDLTTPDVLPYGLRVVRVLASGLQPIHFGFGEERLGGRRWSEVPHRLGLFDRAITEADLNPCPHPLA